MNIQKLEQVRDWLLAGAPERKFDMAVYNDPMGNNNWCGTACCIAGYVFSLDIDFNRLFQMKIVAAFYHAMETLELSSRQAHELFLIQDEDNHGVYLDYIGNFSTVTPQQAAQAVQNLIDHGRPHWAKILGEDMFE